MKTNLILAGVILLALVFHGCEKNLDRISGQGEIVTQTLIIDEFSGIALAGADNVHIKYGEAQHVEVRGHGNIINRIKRKVSNGIWNMELEDGSYSHYDLTYYLTLPYVEYIQSDGSGDVYIEEEMTLDDLEVVLTGSGSFYGFLLNTNTCEIDIIGSGSAEITVAADLDVHIEGSGSVYYKGHPYIKSKIKGSGKIVNAD